MKQLHTYPIGLLLTLVLLVSALAGCSPAPEEAPDITGDWLLVELNGDAVDLSQVEGLREPRMNLDGEGMKAGGNSGVNQFTATYTHEGDAFSLGPIAVTKMMGPPQAQAFEDAYLEALGKVDACSVMEGRLELSGAGQVLAVYQRPGE